MHLMASKVISRALWVLVAACTGLLGTPVNAEEAARKGPREHAFELGAAGVLGASLEVARHGATVVMTATSKDERVELVCLLCDGLEEALAARTLGARLAGRTGRPGPASIDVSGLGAKDRIFVDGLEAPPVDGAMAIEPGEHRIEVHRGKRRLSRDVRLEAAEELLLEVDSMSEHGKKTNGLRLGTAIGGIGAGLITAGAILAAFDGRCASVVVDAQGNCETVHDTAVAGWAILGAGIAAATTGVVVGVIAGARRRREKAREVGR